MIYIPIWKLTQEISENCGRVKQVVGTTGSIFLSKRYDNDLMVPGKPTGVQSMWNSGVCWFAFYLGFKIETRT